MSTLCEWLVAGWFDPIHSRRVRLISTESSLNNDCFWWIICFIFETSQQKQREFCFFCVWLVILFDRVRKPRRGVVMEAMDPKWSTWGKASKARDPNRGSRSDGAEEERKKKKTALLWIGCEVLPFLNQFCASFTSSYHGCLLMHHETLFLANWTCLLCGFFLFEKQSDREF